MPFKFFCIRFKIYQTITTRVLSLEMKSLSWIPGSDLQQKVTNFMRSSTQPPRRDISPKRSTGPLKSLPQAMLQSGEQKKATGKLLRQQRVERQEQTSQRFSQVRAGQILCIEPPTSKYQDFVWALVESKSPSEMQLLPLRSLWQDNEQTWVMPDHSGSNPDLRMQVKASGMSQWSRDLQQGLRTRQFELRWTLWNEEPVSIRNFKRV